MKILFHLVAAVTTGLLADCVLAASSPEAEAKMQAARKLVLELYRDLPLEHQPLGYIRVGLDSYTPAYIDANRKLEARWRGVILAGSQIPAMHRSGSFSVSPMEPTGFKVVEVTPPVRYVLDAGRQRYRAGYFDDQKGQFFEWLHVDFSPDAIMALPNARDLILDSFDSFELPTSFVETPASAFDGTYGIMASGRQRQTHEGTRRGEGLSTVRKVLLPALGLVVVAAGSYLVKRRLVSR